MGTSFVEFKDHGFWSKDSILEGVLYLITREIKKLPTQPWIAQVIEEWTISATTGFVGCIPTSLNKHLDSTHKIQIVVEVIERVIKDLCKDENFISVDELNVNLVGTGGWISIDKLAFQNISELMLQLLSDKLETKAASPIDYWKFEE